MEYREEDQILLHEELCEESTREVELTPTELFHRHIRLAGYVSNQFQSTRDGVISSEDILQDAYEGLWRACLSFDPTKGYEFSTYAIPTIRGIILRDFRSNDQLKLPRIYKDIRSSISRHGFTLPLTDEEIDIIVDEGKFSHKQIIDYAEPRVLSLDYEDEKGRSSIASIPDPQSEMHPGLDEDELESAIDAILRYIKPKQRDIVEEWLYSRMCGEHISYSQLSQKYHISRQRAHRIITAAIAIFQEHQSVLVSYLIG